MLLTSFLIFLVYSTFTKPVILNRLGVLTLIFSFILFITTIEMVPLKTGMSVYNNWFSLNTFNLPLSCLIFISTIVLLLYNSNTYRYDLKSPYYLLLLLLNTIGLVLLPLANDLISLYIIIELQSYSLYLLTGMHNRSYNASRASMLYFLMGGIASTIIIMSSYYIYSYTGTTSINDIYMINNIIGSDSLTYDYFDILVIALLFKMGLAPLHRWSVAVYNYAPTYITAYISIVAKVSIASWIFANAGLFHHNVMIIFFFISLFIGSYKPLFQVNIKTILAYSGILNFGYVLLTIVSYDISFYVYIIQYVLTHIILFLGVLSAGEYANKPISTWSPLLYIHQLKLPNLTLAFTLILALFSLIGIPPLPGFYAKLYILSGALQDNYVLETCTIILCSVIATYYYSNIIKILMKSSNDKSIININSINPSIAYCLALGTVLLLTFFIYLPYLLEGLYIVTI